VIDLILAIAHHVLAFGLVALLLGEAVLLRALPTPVARLTRLDAAYGASAGLILVVGVLRVIFGAKGWEYYVGNPWFWAKMASFLVAALLSIPATRRFGAWRRQMAEGGVAPPPGEVAATLRYIRLQSLFIVLIIAFAATMARYT
jgi:putative membrane protein